MSSTAMSASVCPSVCLSVRLHISQRPHVQTSRNFLHVLPISVARCSADDNANAIMQYAMYAGFADDVMFSHNGPYMARCLSNIDVGGVLHQVINFQRIHQGASHCLTLSSYTVTANGAPGA